MEYKIHCKRHQEECSLNQKEYGEKFKDHLLEQYKLYVELTDRLSQRREHTNNLYISLVSGLFAVIALILNNGEASDLRYILTASISILGTLVCLLWYINIESYRQLNTGRFKVIHEMEKYLPYPCYSREWEMLGEGREPKEYRPITHIQKYVPLAILLPYLILLVYSVYKLL